MSTYSPLNPDRAEILAFALACPWEPDPAIEPEPEFEPDPEFAEESDPYAWPWVPTYDWDGPEWPFGGPPTRED